jgi:hypothetical protein
MTRNASTLSSVLRMATAEASRLAASADPADALTPATLEAIELTWSQIRSQTPWEDSSLDQLGRLISQITRRPISAETKEFE